MRDPKRIPIVLAAIEREWRRHPDQRLGQLVINLLRRHTSVPPENECHVLFDIEDAELLSWLGAECDDEQQYIEDEPLKREVGWGRWMRSQHRHGEEEDVDFWWQPGEVILVCSQWSLALSEQLRDGPFRAQPEATPEFFLQFRVREMTLRSQFLPGIPLLGEGRLSALPLAPSRSLSTRCRGDWPRGAKARSVNRPASVQPLNALAPS